MDCRKYQDAVQELVDGTLGSIRRSELEAHLVQCENCRALLADLRRIRDLTDALDRPAPPDRVWLQVAGRLRQEGRVAASAPVAARSTRHYALIGIAAALLLAVGASLVMLLTSPRGGGPASFTATNQPGGAQPGNAAGNEAVQSVESEFRLAEQHYQNAIAKLEEAAKSDQSAIDPQTAAMLQKNLQVIDQAIAESRAALRTEPTSAPARDSLFEALKRKVLLLQDTIALMNEMRKGNAAGVAQIVEGSNKS
jgi:anti-sigma factor RsiW